MGYHLVFMGSGEGFSRRQKSMKGDYGKVTASVWGGGGGGGGESVEYFITSGALRKFYYDTTKIL